MDGLLEISKLAEEFEQDNIWEGSAKTEVSAAINWIQLMYLHRQWQASVRAEKHHISKEQEALVGTQEEG